MVMEMEMKVISTEIIKPSSPTPKSLQKHQLSSLDQYIPSVFNGFVYFYPSNPKISCSRKSNHLKKSLSETLSRFYPLAGRLVDNLYVDCNDGGALFAEAEASCDVSQFLASRDLKEMNQFLPHKSLGFCLLAVQATYFRCGGLAVGLLISHKIADGLSSVLFFNSWSAISRNGDAGGLPVPKFDAAAYFPPGDVPSISLMLKEENSRKIFTFPAAEIALLRRRYSTAAGAFRPSRVEAVSAFIWTRFVSACLGKKIDPDQTLTVFYPVNLRPRVEPPLSESHFGNIFTTAVAKVDVDDGGAELVMKIREAMKCVDEKESDISMEVRTRAMNGELVCFSFTSLCGFPLYEADFGWGKPGWVGLEGFNMMNLAIFSETESGGGIEALVHLSKQDMKKFEAGLEGYAIKSKL